MFGFEERWVTQVLGAFTPSDGEGLAPRPGEVDYVAAFARMRAAAGPKASFGFRVALWHAALAPHWHWRGRASIGSLSEARRAALLSELLTHRFFVPRELTLMLKVAASMALMKSATVRARTGYDRRDGLDESGEHALVPLGVGRPAAQEVA